MWNMLNRNVKRQLNIWNNLGMYIINLNSVCYTTELAVKKIFYVFTWVEEREKVLWQFVLVLKNFIERFYILDLSKLKLVSLLNFDAYFGRFYTVDVQLGVSKAKMSQFPCFSQTLVLEETHQCPQLQLFSIRCYQCLKLSQSIFHIKFSEMSMFFICNKFIILACSC